MRRPKKKMKIVIYSLLKIIINTLKKNKRSYYSKNNSNNSRKAKIMNKRRELKLINFCKTTVKRRNQYKNKLLKN